MNEKKKRGRPVLENPRNDGYRLRLNAEERAALERVSKTMKCSKSEALRILIMRADNTTPIMKGVDNNDSHVY